MHVNHFLRGLTLIAGLGGVMLTGCAESEPEIQDLAAAGDVEAIERRIGAGEDVDFRRLIGWTALHHAALRGHANVVKVLIEADANVDLRTNDEYRTALHYAAMEGHREIVTMLLEAGAKPAEPDIDDKTPRDLALENGYEEIAAQLEEAEQAQGAPPEAENPQEQAHES